MNKRLLFAFLTTVVFSILIFLRSFEWWELAAYDARLSLRSRLNPLDTHNLPIVFIQIDDKTLATKGLNQFPFPRKYYAAILDVLKSFGAKLAVFDILFAEPTKDDEQFAAAIRAFGRVYLPYSLSLDPNGKYRAVTVRLLPIFSHSAYGKGYITVLPDIDGKRRKIPLRLVVNGRYVYHLSFKAALGLLGINPIRDVENTASSINLIQAKQGEFRIVKIPLYEGKYFYLDYPGRWRQVFNKVSFVDLVRVYNKVHNAQPLDSSDNKVIKQLKGALCIIGLTATGSHDLAPTPLEPSCPMVMTYGIVGASLLKNRFIHRFSPLLPLVVFWLLVALIGVLGRTLLRLWLLWLGLGVIWLIVNGGLFIYAGWWLDVLGPFFGSFVLVLGQSFFLYIENLKERQRVEQEMALASEIQRKMLPRELPKLEGISCEVYFSPAVFVAGDFYDVWKSKNGLRIFLGDVSGKGVSASLYVAQTITAERVLRARFDNDGVNRLLEEINKFLARFKISGVYATACMLEVDKERLRITDAGHVSVWVYREDKDEIEEVKLNKGAPLGIDRWSEYSLLELSWRQGDVIVLFSDGLLEARKGNEFINENKLKEWIKENIDLELCNIDVLMADFYQGESQSDDITLLLIRNLGV